MLTDYDMLLQKGVLEPSMFELLANIFRQYLPKDVVLHRPHILRSQKTGPDQITKHSAVPRVQIFPYRSNSKMWAVFLVTHTEEKYSLHVVTPAKFDVEAFDWATNHLRWQYKIQSDTTYATWPSARGSELLLLLGLAREILDDVKTNPAAQDEYVAHILETLKKIRAVAIASNVSDIDELLPEHRELAENVKNLFAAWLKVSAPSPSLA